MSHFDPTQDTPIKVELQINGVWTDVTARGRAVRDVRIKHAQSDGAIQPETSTCELVLGNDDGWLNEDDLRSPWYPHIGRGTPMRVSLAGLGESDTDAPRFTGEIDEMEAVYQGGDNAVMSVLANGTWGVLAQGNEELRSPMFRSFAGVGPSDYVPLGYWSMEDPDGSSRFASGLAGQLPMMPAGQVSFGAQTDMIGSAPLPTFATNATAAAQVPAYAPTSQWVVMFTMLIPSEPASKTAYVELAVTGATETLWRIVVNPTFTPAVVDIETFDSTGAAVNTMQIQQLNGGGFDWEPSEDQFYGTWATYVIASESTGGGNLEHWSGLSIGPEMGITGALGTADGHGSITGIKVLGGNGASFGHVAVYVDPAFQIFFGVGSDASANSAAVFGHRGETVAERIARLGREEGVTVTVVGSSSHLMGPQRVARLTDLFTDCQQVDQGIWSDDVSAIGLTYRCLSHLYSQSPRVHVERGALTPQTRARWDNQRIGNDWTVSRSGGSSAHDSDEAHVAKHRRRFRRSATLHVATDDVLIHHASWRVHLGTVEGPRYPSLGIDMRNPDGAKLDDQILAMIPGDRLTAAAVALPSQHPPGGLDQMVIGWSELLDADEWKIYPVCVPYEPFVVAVLDSDTSGKLDSASSSLMSGVTSSATSLTVTTSLETDLWTTDPGETPIPLTVGGEDMTATAIASALLDTFTRTVGAGSWGTSDSGHTWTLSSAASCSVNGTQGVINLAVTNVERHATTDIGASGMVSMTAQQALGVTPTGAAINWGILLRFTDASNYYWADVQVGTDSSLTLRLIKRVAGAAAQMATVTAPITHSTSVPRVLRAQYDPDTGVFRSRIWSSAAAEPPVWHLSTTDTAVPASTHAGVISRLVTGNTNGSTNFLWDRLEADNPQLFTVTRSVNGVVEAHSAGAEVHVKNPIRLAL